MSGERVVTEYSVAWYDDVDGQPVGPLAVREADFERWIRTAEAGFIVMACQRTITTSDWTGYESTP